MELLLTLAMKFWMWTILIIVVILGAVVNLFDKKEISPCYTYKHKKMPVLIPIPIKTKGKGFFYTFVVTWCQTLGTSRRF